MNTWDMQVPQLRRRSPRTREEWLAAERLRRVIDGSSTTVVDAVIATMRASDRDMLAAVLGHTHPVMRTFVAEHRDDLAVVPASVAYRLVVEATVGYLLGSGVMEPADLVDPPPPAWQLATPAHLWPDVAGAVARHRVDG